MSDCCLIKKVATVEVYENKNEVRDYGFMAGDRNTPVMEVKFRHLWGEENLSKCKLRWIIVDDLGSLLVGEVPIEQDNTASIQLPNELFTGERRMKVQLTVASCDGSRILNLQQFTDLKVINNLASNEVVEPVYQILINTLYDEVQRGLDTLDDAYAKSKASLEQYLITAQNGGNAEFLQGYSPVNFIRSENTINELINSATGKYKLGDTIDLNGYYTAGDGAHHKRKIESADDGSGVQLANGLWANIVHSGEVNVSWFGAKGDGVTDDTVAIQKSLSDTSVRKINIDNKKYKIDNTLYINNDNRGLHIVGQNRANEESEKVEFLANTGEFAFMELTGASNVTFENIQIMSRGRGLSNPSLIIFFLARGLVKQHCNLIIFKNVNMKIASVPSANNGLGTICLYNFRGEILSFYNTRFFSDTPVVMSGGNDLFYTPKHAQVKHTVGGDSCTVHGFYDCMIESSLKYCLKLNNVSSFNMYNSYLANWSDDSKVLASLEQCHAINLKEFHAESFKATTSNKFVEILGRNSDLTFKGYIHGLNDKTNFIDIAETGYIYDSCFDVYIIDGVDVNFVKDTPNNVDASILNTDFYRFEPSKFKVFNANRNLTNCRFYSRDNSILEIKGDVTFETLKNSKTTKTFEAKNIKTNSVSLINNSLKDTILSLPDGMTILSLPASNEIPRPVYGYVTRRISGISGNDATLGIFTTSQGGASFKGEIFTIVHNGSEADIIINRQVLSSAFSQNVDTPYYTYKMQQEGIYEDYIAYRDELHEYENSRVLDDTMMLPVLHEPEIPESVRVFAEKYKLI